MLESNKQQAAQDRFQTLETPYSGYTNAQHYDVTQRHAYEHMRAGTSWPGEDLPELASLTCMKHAAAGHTAACGTVLGTDTPHFHHKRAPSASQHCLRINTLQKSSVHQA
jgi:hypothetical protein